MSYIFDQETRTEFRRPLTEAELNSILKANPGSVPLNCLQQLKLTKAEQQARQQILLQLPIVVEALAEARDSHALRNLIREHLRLAQAEKSSSHKLQLLRILKKANLKLRKDERLDLSEIEPG